MKENNSLISYEMYEDLKESIIKTLKAEVANVRPATDDTSLRRIEQQTDTQTDLLGLLTDKEEQALDGIRALQTAVQSIELPKALPPRITHHRLSVTIESKNVFYLLVGMVSLIALLFCALYFETRPDSDRIGNDLKYRYIKMKGEADPKCISELENIFERHRDNSKIRQLQKEVEEYETRCRIRAKELEQARLNEEAAKRLQEEAARLRQK